MNKMNGFIESVMDTIEDFMADTLVHQGIVNEPDDGDAILTGPVYDILKEKIEETCRNWRVNVR